MSAPLLLVVEDDHDVREALTDILRDAGYRVAWAVDGREAMRALRGGLRPDAILLDLMMPEMDGWQFREEQLRDSALREIPVVVMSASRGIDVAALGGAEILRKPIGLAEILGAVERNALRA